MTQNNPEQVIKTPLIISALKEFCDIDRLIIIGTAGSDWASLYEYIYSDSNSSLPKIGEFDENYYIELGTIFERTREKSPELLMVEDMQKILEPLKNSLGDFCDSICILNYGTDNTQQLENLSMLNKIASGLQDGDQVYFDISHAFRSLPIYELLVVNLAKSALGKRIEIAGVSYGMFEARNLFGGCTPIVDMGQLVELMDWTRAVDEFNRFGTAYLLADLLGSESIIAKKVKGLLSREEGKIFKRLGDSISSNNMNDFQSLVRICVRIKNNEQKPISRDPLLMAIEPIITNIANDFGEFKDDPVALQLAISCWHFEKKRYLHCCVSSIEGVINMSLSIIGAKTNDEVNKNKMRDILCGRKDYHRPTSENKYVTEIIGCYNSARKLRNTLAHGGILDDSELKSLKEHSSKFKSLYLKRFLADEENKNALVAALKKEWD